MTEPCPRAATRRCIWGEGMERRSALGRRGNAKIQKMPKVHNHYVPKFYLRGFTDAPSSENLFVYEKGKVEPFRTQIKNIGNEVGLYTDEIEKILANDIEQSANPILQKIRSLEPIFEDEKLTLARYMFTMWLRVPKHRDWFIAKSPKIVNKYLADVETQLQELVGKHPDKTGLIQQRIGELHAIRRDKTDEIAREMWLKNIPAGLDRAPVQMLADMEWRFLDCGRDEFFLASDNPVYFPEAIGIGNEKSELSFPVAQNLVLLAKRQFSVAPAFHRARPAIVKEINRRSAANALKFVFAPRRAEWIPILLNKKNPRLNRILL